MPFSRPHDFLVTNEVARQVQRSQNPSTGRHWSPALEGVSLIRRIPPAKLGQIAAIVATGPESVRAADRPGSLVGSKPSPTAPRHDLAFAFDVVAMFVDKGHEPAAAAPAAFEPPTPVESPVSSALDVSEITETLAEIDKEVEDLRSLHAIKAAALEIAFDLCRSGSRRV